MNRQAGFVTLRITGGRGSRTGCLSIPSRMMSALKLGMVFKPEFTSEGILFRYVKDVPKDAPQVEPPEWAT